jgi:hypothetical protein
MGQLVREHIAVAMGRSIRRSVGHDSDRDPAVAICGVDGIESGGSYRISNIRHDAEDLDFALLLENIGHSDRSGIVPPEGQIRVDDDVRRVAVPGINRCRGR